MSNNNHTIVPIITVKNVNFAYDGPVILENINFTLKKGSFTALIGPNGGGKSTLLKIILGLLKPTSGGVTIYQQNKEKSHLALGYVSQYPQFSRNYPISVEETVLMGCLHKSHLFGFNYSSTEKQYAAKAMQDTGIFELRHTQLGKLSGGQLQRVLIARALASQPECLILDEPTANIDLRTEENIFDLLKTLNKTITILVVSHDIGFISQYVTDIACLNRTLIDHTVQNLNKEMIEQLYHEPVKLIQHTHF